jgi:hypothetical protein
VRMRICEREREKESVCVGGWVGVGVRVGGWVGVRVCVCEI